MIQWVYEAPDGASYELKDQVINGAVTSWLSTDSSYIRMQKDPQASDPNHGYRKIELPDGTVQEFKRFGVRGDWRLISTTDAFGNALTSRGQCSAM